MKKLPLLLLSASLIAPTTVVPSVTYAAQGQQVQQSVLTYEQAFKQALAKSYTLKNVKADIERSEQVRDKAAENVKYTPISNGNPQAYSQYNEIGNRSFTGYQQAAISYQLSKEQVRIEEDKITLGVRKAYNEVLNAQTKKKLADLTVQNDEIQRTVSQYKYQSGIVSNADNVKAERTYQANKKAQAAAAGELSSSYEKLNQLIGLSPQARPVLIEQPEMKIMPEVDLEGHISRIMSDNPQLVQANKNIDIARLNLDLYMFNDPNTLDTYDAKKIDVIKAENKYADAKEQTAQSLRNIYYAIRQFEDNYKSLEENLAVAEESLRVIKVQYDVGMATKLDVSNATLNVEKLKQKMFEITVQHDNFVQAFYKPWAANLTS